MTWVGILSAAARRRRSVCVVALNCQFVAERSDDTFCRGAYVPQRIASYVLFIRVPQYLVRLQLYGLAIRRYDGLSIERFEALGRNRKDRGVVFEVDPGAAFHRLDAGEHHLLPKLEMDQPRAP
jgi:hypothetical protein